MMKDSGSDMIRFFDKKYTMLGDRFRSIYTTIVLESVENQGDEPFWDVR
jgi:hypothetical protein